jgi:hypothetical protein
MAPFFGKPKIEGREEWGESREERKTVEVNRPDQPSGLSPVSFLLTNHFFHCANALHTLFRRITQIFACRFVYFLKTTGSALSGRRIAGAVEPAFHRNRAAIHGKS